MMKLPGAQLIEIEFHYHDTPQEKRTERALVLGINDDGLDDETFEFEDLSVHDDNLFYMFTKDEEIVGTHSEFEVTKSTVIAVNPLMLPPNYAINEVDMGCYQIIDEANEVEIATVNAYEGQIMSAQKRAQILFDLLNDKVKKELTSSPRP